jgi:hypothetical protein
MRIPKRACRQQRGPVLYEGREGTADDLPVPAFGPRLVCTSGGIAGADARPNLGDRRQRPKLMEIQWGG